jgi:hypothetical protein
MYLSACLPACLPHLPACLLQCKHISAPCIQSVFQHHHLLRLNLSFSDVISDESFMLLPPPSSSASSSSSSSSYTAHGSLEQLALGMSSISDLSLTRLAHTYSHSLQHLSLEWCCSITDAGVAVLAAQCSLLLDVSLKACRGVGDASVRAIGQSCGRLVRLDVSWCSAVTDWGILQLTPARRAACCGLQRLVAGWTQMTGESLGLGGLQALPRLREVQAAGCAGIASRDVHAMEKRGISLTI